MTRLEQAEALLRRWLRTAWHEEYSLVSETRAWLDSPTRSAGMNDAELIRRLIRVGAGNRDAAAQPPNTVVAPTEQKPAPRCAWFCGRDEADHDEEYGESHIQRHGVCYCTEACRDAGHPTHPEKR